MNTSNPTPPHAPFVGRGANVNPPNRFERLHVEIDRDLEPEERPSPRTQFFFDHTETIIAENDSPDIPFSRSVNPYRGCEHGCAYCFARPFHEYLGFSSGLDFKTKIMVKLRAPELLRAELSSRRWQPQSLTFSGVTDCYQPAERHFRITRGCLEVCAEFRNPVAIVTKNALVTRDVDLLASLARLGAAAVFVSVTSLDADLAGKLEPRAARPAFRLQAIRGRHDQTDFGTRRDQDHAGFRVGRIAKHVGAAPEAVGACVARAIERRHVLPAQGQQRERRPAIDRGH